MVAENGGFHSWNRRWMDVASFTGPRLTDPDERMRAVMEMWHESVPGNWRRDLDRQLLGPRYRRGDFESPNPGEHTIEHEILVKFFGEVSCMGARLIDGVNAMPFARDSGGSRRGNVEADLLLLLRKHDEYRLAVCEVKDSANNAWYAAVESLRQFKLLQLSSAAQEVFHHRNPEIPLPAGLPSMALVIAPREYYSRRGQKANAHTHAESLLNRFRTETGLDARLTCWDIRSTSISAL